MAHLLLLLNEDAARSGVFTWALRDGARVLRRGQGTASDLPHGEGVVGVIAADCLSVMRRRVPGGRAALQVGVLGYALEDGLLEEPDDTHVLRLGEDAEGRTLAVVVARPLLATLIGALSAAGRTLARIVAETSLAAVKPGRWTVLAAADGGWLFTALGYPVSVDIPPDGSAPTVLRIALAEAGTGRPDGIDVWLRDAGAHPRVARWAVELGLEVVTAGSWDWAMGDWSVAPDLRVGDLRPRPGWQERMRALRVPLAVLGLVGVVHLLGVLGLLGVRSLEERDLRNEAVALFREAFPEATAVVDPVLQMRRQMGGLLRAAGEAGAEDFLALLGRCSPVLAQLPPQALRGLEYRQGRLSLVLGLPEAATGDLRGRLEALGLSVGLETTGDPATALRLNVGLRS
ncbi:MAG: hypothetical protein HY778_12565 [Betaproteobacteria bacterium]|nr:hypothetical protein [Betaproteobacteria bacterium]